MDTDYVQRFLFENLDVRGRLVCLTGAWQRMTEGRGYPGPIVELLGHATALAAILGANHKHVSGSKGRITLQVQGSGPVQLLVDDCASGMKIRGMAQHAQVLPENAPAGRLFGDGRLAVTLEGESILAEQGEVVIKNEMCNHEYRFDRAAVETLFA